MTGPSSPGPGDAERSEVDPHVLAGEPGSARQLEGGDDEMPALGQDPDEWAAADALMEGQPTELGESRP